MARLIGSGIFEKTTKPLTTADESGGDGGDLKEGDEFK